MIPILKIAKSWFYSAGTAYGWKNDGYDSKGVGIAKNLLAEHSKLYIEVDGLRYLLDCKEARAFVVKYKSVEKRGGAKVCVVSKSILTAMEPENVEDLSPRPKKELEKLPETANLFGPTNIN